MDNSTLMWRVVLHSFANEILHSFMDDNILVENGPADKKTLLVESGPSTYRLRMIL